MPHTESQKINVTQAGERWDSSGPEVRQWINSQVTPSEAGTFFGVLTYESKESLLAAVSRFNAYIDDHGDGGGGDNGAGDPTAPDFMKDFHPDDDIAVTERTTVSSGIFSGGTTELTAFYTSSTLGDTSASYIPVYDKVTTDSSAQVQFAVGYGHISGSGSIGNTTKTTAGNRETAAIYRQFRNVILGQGSSNFVFTSAPATNMYGESTTNSNDFFFIVFNRAQMREKVDPGNWEIHMSGSYTAGAAGASGNVTKFIDDSSATTNATIGNAGRVFNIVSGSISTGTAVIETAAASETAAGAAGLFYPDLGIMLFNPHYFQANGVLRLGEPVGWPAHIGTTAGSGSDTFGFNADRFLWTIQSGSYFKARREEEISSISYFARAKNREFNFSANPTYEGPDSNGTRGAFAQPTFKGDPKSYITQVGLYDDSLDLLAVAKLSQPVLKSFSREATIKVKLDF